MDDRRLPQVARNRPSSPGSVTEATKAYLAAEDTLAAWIEDCCVVGDNKFEAWSLLFASWKKWAQEAGEKQLNNQREFGKALDTKGYEPKKKNGTRCRLGIELTDKARAEAEEALQRDKVFS